MDWIERSPSGAVVIYRKKNLLQFDEAGSPAAGSAHNVTIRPPGALERSNEENRRPWFAGSFCAPSNSSSSRRIAQRALASRATSARFTARYRDRSVRGRDREASFGAHSLAAPLGRRSASPHGAQLGFVLPLIEVCSVDGNPVVTYRSEDWVEITPANSLFFPKQSPWRWRAVGQERLRKVHDHAGEA